MFVKAIEEVGNYTQPIITITRNYNETVVSPGAGTLFFVNENGVAVTCRHITELLLAKNAINDNYEKFKKEKDGIGKNKYNQRLRELEAKYQYKADVTIQLKELFMGCTSDPTINFKCINHPQLDLAIIVFNNFKNPLYKSYAKFAKDTSSIKPGKYLCRLGYPFPEFTNFTYNKTTDDIEWTNTGTLVTPRFPIEGMMTRHLIKEGMGFELSTPGLRGQSGGPVFNEDGLICGMQSSTNHLHLGFDMKNFEYKTNGKPIKVSNQPFLHVGHCIHADIIKDFLKINGIVYYEG
jgi:hypothetical protein